MFELFGFQFLVKHKKNKINHPDNKTAHHNQIKLILIKVTNIGNVLNDEKSYHKLHNKKFLYFRENLNPLQSSISFFLNHFHSHCL